MGRKEKEKKVDTGVSCVSMFEGVCGYIMWVTHHRL